MAVEVPVFPNHDPYSPTPVNGGSPSQKSLGSATSLIPSKHTLHSIKKKKKDRIYLFHQVPFPLCFKVAWFLNFCVSEFVPLWTVMRRPSYLSSFFPFIKDHRKTKTLVLGVVAYLHFFKLFLVIKIMHVYLSQLFSFLQPCFRSYFPLFSLPVTLY